LLVVSLAAAPQDPATRQQTYRAERGPGDAKELHARFSADQIGTLEALNRVDAAHLSSLEELIVPDAWHADLRLYSPFPSRIDGGGMNFPKLLIVGCYAFGGDPLWRSVEWLASGIGLPTTATMQDRPCPGASD
jgi:hypothetical protein